MKTQTQTQTKHTPGPWKARPDGITGNTAGIPGCDDVETVAIVDAYYPHAPIAANAALISAAPELLEALRGLWNIATHPKATKADIRMIARECEAAIAKAEGGAA